MNILTDICAHYIFATCIVMVTSFLNILVIMGHLRSHRVLVKSGELRGFGVRYLEKFPDACEKVLIPFLRPYLSAFCWDRYLWRVFFWDFRLQSFHGIAAFGLGNGPDELENPTCNESLVSPGL